MIKNILIATTSLLLFTACNTKSNSLLITKDSKYDIQNTVKHFSDEFAKLGYKTIKVIHHSPIAKKENIYLKPVDALVINNDKVSSALLTCNPSLAIEMPIRISIYEELGGNVKFSYTQPEYWSLKHNIKDKNCINVVLQIAREFDQVASDIATK